jgi:prolyl-tRNA synthetase
MRLSRFHLHTVKEVPADAEIASHQLMLRAGMIRKLAAGIYTWTPLGLRVLRKVETVVREEMEAAGAIEVLMPAIQPKELWEETGRWQVFGGQLLKIRDRKDAEYCFGPTHEEVITDFARAEIKSYRQLPLNFFQIQWKFRDEIRPRFGIMRAREFLMKDAYSFHLDEAGLDAEYRNMYRAYERIFTRLQLKFRAVIADSGAIGGAMSHEFHVLAESGEDAIAYSDGSDYAANIEMAEAVVLPPPPELEGKEMRSVATPTQRSIAEVSEFLGVLPAQCVKTLVVMGPHGPCALCLRGDHELNEVKAAKAAGIEGDFRLATDEEVIAAFRCQPGFVGPVKLNELPATVPLIVDRSARELVNFVCGANRDGYHEVGARWDELQVPFEVADLRTVNAGDPSPDGHGTLGIARGIEVGHVFQLGQKYAKAMNAVVLDEQGKARVMHMGCYGVGVSRIMAAAIEQNHDERGIIWPQPMAPWQVAVCVINPKNDPAVTEAADTLYRELDDAGLDPVLDDRGLRPGSMFADIELIGIPHRVVVSERGLAAGTFEYRHRRAADSEALGREALLARLTSAGA